MATRILIADCLKMFREVLVRQLELEPDFSVVADTDDGDQLIKHVKRHKPDVILLDFQLRKHSAIEVLKDVSGLKMDVRSILLTDRIEKSDAFGGSFEPRRA